jgi:hypothetical protein
VPVLPSCVLEPVWAEFAALLGGERPEFDPAHPLGCHRRRVPDGVVHVPLRRASHMGRHLLCGRYAQAARQARKQRGQTATGEKTEKTGFR